MSADPVALKLPPGVFRPGTKYDSRGRWWDANLVRWLDNAMGPVGGWAPLQHKVGGVDTNISIGEVIRGMLAWRGNEGSTHLAFGGPTKLYHFGGTTLTDITPADFSIGATDSSLVSGAYGAGAYGAGLYGTGDPDRFFRREAQTWQLDNFGQDLIAMAYSDRRILRWSKGSSGPAEPIAEAPVDVRGIVVTPERFVVALGADGDGRRVAWCSQGEPDVWDPVPSTSTAGDLQLADTGEAMCGLRGRGETLIWTNTALHQMRYVGLPFVYGIQRVASGCGVISRQAAGMLGGNAYWMGRKAFFRYAGGGGVQPVPSEVADYVFGDINVEQASKVACRVLADYGEITWHYPSAASVENDRYVTFNEREGHWSIGRLERTSGVDRGAFDDPFAADAAGNVYTHETGSSYLDTDGLTALEPYAESGPLEIGEQLMHVMEIVSDEGTSGDVQLSVLTYGRPGDAEITQGPFAISQPVRTRFSSRLARLRVVFQNATARFGTPKLDVRAGGRR